MVNSSLFPCHIVYYRLLWILSVKYDKKVVIEVDFNFFLAYLGFRF